MNRTEPLLPCPHCGKEMRAGSLTRHTPLCIKNPTAFARYCEVLAGEPGSKQGITCGQYVQLSEAPGSTLPTVVTLRRLTGAAKWDGVLAVFGLEPPAADQRHGNCPHCGKFISGTNMAGHLQECAQVRAAPKPPPPPRKERKPINIFVPRKPAPPKAPQTCPQCNMTGIDPLRHQCPEDPVILAWLAATLPDPADPERIITCAEYKALPERAIGLVTLTRYYGTWPALAKRFGLVCRERRTGPPELTPAVRAVLHRLADELHNNEYGPSISEYQVYAGTPVKKAHALRDAFGSWNAVLAAAGLQPGERGQYHRAANARRKAHEAARGAMGPVPSKYERGDEAIPREVQGLFVGDARKPPVIKPAPGLRVNGRECVRVVLR